jgi:hypothetical protein
MTLNKIIEVLDMRASNSVGHIGNVEFCVMQGAHFSVQGVLHHSRFLAFTEETKNTEYIFCDTIEELLENLKIGGKPLGEQIDRIKDFDTVKCNN